jgi:hypothetical protein
VSARLEFAKIEAFIVSNDKFSLRLMRTGGYGVHVPADHGALNDKSRFAFDLRE